MTTNPTTPWTDPSTKRVLITGATSGLGFEAAKQLAGRGVGAITITARTADKATTALNALVEDTGTKVFDHLVVDVADLASAQAAAEQLVANGDVYDGVILNAGMVPNELHHSADGYEECFASSLIGHHLITSRLAAHDLLAPGARVIIVGSEAANNDLPKAMGMTVPSFLTDPSADDDAFTRALDGFAHGPDPFDGPTQYAGTKAVAAMWAPAMQRRHGHLDFFTVSPGSAMGTNAARHATGAFKMMVAVMRRIGGVMGMSQSIPVAASRYCDVMMGTFSAEPGGLYTSGSKKMTGPLTKRDVTYLRDARTQDLAVAYLDSVVAVSAA